MKAYCINLDRRPDRLAHMTAEFARTGIPFERIPAVDGQDPDVAAAAARLPLSRIGTRISAGAHGCFESHREFWRRLVLSGDNWGMVFEDDVLLAPGIAAYLQNDWLPADADIVKLETAGVRVHISTQKLRAPEGRSLAKLHTSHRGTGGYIISSVTAHRLLQETVMDGDAVDDVLFSTYREIFKTMRVYQMVPAPVIQGQNSVAGATARWAETSLSERFVGRVDPKEFPKDPLILRLRKILRVRQRLRGIVLGTRFVVVPHG